ncbi:PAS domain S-box protein [Romboutsia maritimum]|uniref:histidine kinase n=1 Tax=Romboutsia maritimum TaxID=2020948 RepID=A0A371IV20_9FIRM|nr:ATP-binding protein [Romboutsia maritimum]RDY24315.1 PAS domain S-box protein [Romboutsia maritimum]
MEYIFDKIDNYMLVINKQGNLKYCNKPLLLRLGYIDKEIESLNLIEIVHNSQDKIKNILDGTDKKNIDLELYSKNKKIIFVKGEIIFEKWKSEDSIFILLKEISEEYYSPFLGCIKDLENVDKQIFDIWGKSRSSELNELELFLTTAADLIGIVDKQGYYKQVSSTWTTILGWTSEELLSMNFKNIMHPDEVENFINSIKLNLINKNLIRLNNRCLCKNGEYKWLEISIKNAYDKDIYIVTAKDITYEKEIEDEKKKLQEAIHLEGIKNEFFANISHEFKTPLNIILGTMQLLSKNIDRGRIKYSQDINLISYINSIKQNSYRLLRLVNNLIDMTRIDTGYYEIHLGNYNIVNIVEEITMSVTQYVEDKGINILFDTNVEELELACDPDKIERIMLNLLSNAIKYTDEDGAIFVDLKYYDNKVSISVKDNGIGISKDKINKIFERFGQANNSFTRRCEGSGIGLSLVKSLVEMHDGKIHVKSEPSYGSEFIFEIPVRLVDDEKLKTIDINYKQFQIEKCNIEFSDIYSI